MVTNRNVYVPINYNDLDESILLMLLEDYPHLAEEGQGVLDDADLAFAKTYEDPAYW